MLVCVSVGVRLVSSDENLTVSAFILPRVVFLFLRI